MKVDLQTAVERLNREDVVAMPTETVYGLAARIDSPRALRLIFSTKQRPFFDPLIVHVSSVAQARTLTPSWGAAATALAARFWPGPLTLVLPRSPLVDPLITSGLESVGLRCPDHSMARELIDRVGVPLAAPSANRFGRTSPTTAAHVEAEFEGHVAVLDGGSCQIGIESTVLWLEESAAAVEWKILRPGQVLGADLQACFAEAKIPHRQRSVLEARLAPGQLKHHYMPEIPLIRSEGARVPLSEITDWANARLSELPEEVEGVRLKKPGRLTRGAELILPRDPVLAARELYSALREQSRAPTDHLVFFQEALHDAESWTPVLDRLRKASSLARKGDEAQGPSSVPGG